MDIKTLQKADFTKGYKLIDRVLTRIKNREGGKLADVVARATVEEYTQAPDKSEFDQGVLMGALEWLPDPVGGYGFDKETGCSSQDNIDGWE